MINNILRTALRIVGDRHGIEDLDVEVNRVYAMIQLAINEELLKDAMADAIVRVGDEDGEARPNAQVEGFSYEPFFDPLKGAY